LRLQWPQRLPPKLQQSPQQWQKPRLLLLRKLRPASRLQFPLPLLQSPRVFLPQFLQLRLPSRQPLSPQFLQLMPQPLPQQPRLERRTLRQLLVSQRIQVTKARRPLDRVSQDLREAARVEAAPLPVLLEPPTDFYRNLLISYIFSTP
jgi:hypothetical protein